jgi:hypothetical protein
MSRLFVIAASFAVMAALISAGSGQCGQYCFETRQCSAGCVCTGDGKSPYNLFCRPVPPGPASAMAALASAQGGQCGQYCGETRQCSAGCACVGDGYDVFCRPRGSTNAPTPTTVVVVRSCGDAACSRSCSTKQYTTGRCEAAPGAKPAAVMLACRFNVTVSQYGTRHCSAAPQVQSYPQHQCIRDPSGGWMQLTCNAGV